MTPQETLTHYERALASRDWDTIAPFVAPDATFWFSDGSFHGHDAIHEACERTWSAIPDERYWLDNVTWIAMGETAACCIYRFNWTGIVDGNAIAGNGRGTTVLRKQGSQWHIVHEHLSRNP